MELGRDCLHCYFWLEIWWALLSFGPLTYIKHDCWRLALSRYGLETTASYQIHLRAISINFSSEVHLRFQWQSMVGNSSSLRGWQKLLKAVGKEHCGKTLHKLNTGETGRIIQQPSKGESKNNCIANIYRRHPFVFWGLDSRNPHILRLVQIPCIKWHSACN